MAPKLSSRKNESLSVLLLIEPVWQEVLGLLKWWFSLPASAANVGNIAMSKSQLYSLFQLRHPLSWDLCDIRDSEAISI